MSYLRHGSLTACPKSHSKWRSWHGTLGKFEVECMFFLLTITAFPLPPGRPSTLRIRVQEGAMRDTSPSCMKKCYILLLSVVSTACFNRVVLYTHSLYSRHWLRHSQSYHLRRRVGERMQILKTSYEGSKEVSLVWNFVYYLLTVWTCLESFALWIPIC